MSPAKKKIERLAKRQSGVFRAIPAELQRLKWNRNADRTLCDIVRGNNTCDIQIVNQAMKYYAESKGKDIQKLTGYAKKLRVKPKIQNYMEILL